MFLDKPRPVCEVRVYWWLDERRWFFRAVLRRRYRQVQTFVGVPVSVVATWNEDVPKVEVTVVDGEHRVEPFVGPHGAPLGPKTDERGGSPTYGPVPWPLHPMDGERATDR